jgi:hypothetical protein
MDDKAKAFFDDLRRVMVAHNAWFDSHDEYDGREEYCGTRWQICLKGSATDLAEVDRIIGRNDSTPPNEQVEKVNATAHAMTTLKESMRKDPDYAWTWHCNLACCAFDEGVNIVTANDIAARFMSLAFSLLRVQYDPKMKKENPQ